MATDTPKPDVARLRIDRSRKVVREPARRRPRWLVPLIVVAALAAGYLTVRSLFAATPEVEVGSATLTSASQANALLTASGYVVARQKASVASKGTGRLVMLGVEEGDVVKKGDVIARLEDADVLAQLSRARADLEVARADSFDAARTLVRTRELHARQLSSQAELDAAEARFRRVSAGITSAHAAVQAAAVDLENTRIRAPFDGTVLTKDADVGEVVAPFASSANSRGAVVTLADMSSLEVEADVSESNIGRIAPGQPAEITLDAAPEKRYAGFVHKVVPTADRGKATVQTKVRFKERDATVLPEMSAKVTFLSREPDPGAAAAPQITVPSSAVTTRNGAPAVLVVRDGVIEERVVTMGANVAGRTQIISGLEPGVQVVLSPAANLAGGTKVKIKGS
jgi:RND family efflux transporter MFP subunit